MINIPPVDSGENLDGSVFGYMLLAGMLLVGAAWCVLLRYSSRWKRVLSWCCIVVFMFLIGVGVSAGIRTFEERSREMIDYRDAFIEELERAGGVNDLRMLPLRGAVLSDEYGEKANSRLVGALSRLEEDEEVVAPFLASVDNETIKLELMFVKVDSDSYQVKMLGEAGVAIDFSPENTAYAMSAVSGQ